MRKIEIFLGGGVKLLHGENEFLRGYRNDVIDPIISQLNSQTHAKHLFITKDYSDLTRNVVPGKHQDVYNNYIVHDANVALFIIDGEVGNITKQEIDLAIASTKKVHHPIVFIYGKNVNDNDKILHYLNQEGIYFQHFYDNRDLSAKIKADLIDTVKIIDRKWWNRFLISITLSLLLFCSVFFFIKNCINADSKIIASCSAQLYLPEYKDVNSKLGVLFFTDSILSNFQYEDTILAGNSINVFPKIGSDTVVYTTPPFFRIKLSNKHKNTIVFVSAELEIDQYSKNSVANDKLLIPLEFKNDNVHVVNVYDNETTYSLKGFRQYVGQKIEDGKPDQNYFFCIKSDANCTFRMRVKIKSQTGDVLYTNYVYLKYIT